MVTRYARRRTRWRAPDHALGQILARTIEFLDPNPIFETRQGRLRSQVATFDRIAVQE